MTGLKAHQERLANDLEMEAIKNAKLEREQKIVASRCGLGEMSDDNLSDFEFVMGRMYDPCNFDHTTLEAMLATYHARNLEKSKIFRIAKKIFGDKMESKFRVRNRVFNLTGVKEGVPGRRIMLCECLYFGLYWHFAPFAGLSC